MTFSLLARDPKTGKLGGVAATGNLCVGGWVLSATAKVGIVASQGQAPSTLWRELALARMTTGMSASEAVAATIASDSGREHRQLTALDMEGQGGAFTGSKNGNFKGHAGGKGCIASGNILAGPSVLEQMVFRYEKSAKPFEDRLIEALIAGDRMGGDERGVLSAAMLIVSNNMAPLCLRIDYHDAPIAALCKLLNKTREPGYQAWLESVPNLDRPHQFAPPVTAAKTGTD